jgi:hypothetical protein
MNRTIARMAVLAFGLTVNAEEPVTRLEIGKPTVVTVHARVCPEKAGERRKPSRLKLAGFKVLTAAGAMVGWLLNVNDDIPPARERSERSLKNRSNPPTQAGESSSCGRTL